MSGLSSSGPAASAAAWDRSDIPIQCATIRKCIVLGKGRARAACSKGLQTGFGAPEQHSASIFKHEGRGKARNKLSQQILFQQQCRMILHSSGFCRSQCAQIDQTMCPQPQKALSAAHHPLALPSPNRLRLLLASSPYGPRPEIQEYRFDCHEPRQRPS